MAVIARHWANPLDVIVLVDPGLTLIESHQISDQIEERMGRKHNIMSVHIHVEPSELPGEEVKKAVQKYTQHLSEEHRATYKEKADELIDEFHRAYIEDPGFKGSLETCGYTAEHYPWKG